MEKETSAGADSAIPNDSINIGHASSLIDSATTPSVAKKQRDTKEVEKWLKRLYPHLDTPIERRSLAFTSVVAAKSAKGSRSFASSEDGAAASAASARFIQHLDQVLSAGNVSDEHMIDAYLIKLYNLRQSRLSSDDCQPYTPCLYHRLLIQRAATASKKIYNPQDGLIYLPWGDDKACAIWCERINGHQMLVVAVRGTASLEDILLDVNNELEESRQLRYGTAKWHRGFLRVAENMEVKVKTRIADLREKRCPRPRGIIFTGHSMGGGVAQILFTLSLTPGTELFNVMSDLEEVHCITFGAPPIATIRVEPPSDRGVFLAIMNEGDPVPLAQESYLKTLIDLFVLSPKKFEERRVDRATLDTEFHVSGSCVVLRDDDYEQSTSPKQTAVEVDSSVVENAIFGDPWMHLMDQYLERLECFALIDRHDVWYQIGRIAPWRSG